MDSSVSLKDQIWFLRMCHHVSNVLYYNRSRPTRTPRKPVLDWTDTPADVNGLVHFAGRPNLVSARVPSRSVCTLPRAFPGSKGGRCVRLKTLPPSCAVFMKSGNLNFLEPSGPLQACNGTDLPLPLLFPLGGEEGENSKPLGKAISGLPWRRQQHIPPKYRCLPTTLHITW